MRESAATKARRYLSEGRITLIDVSATSVSALVRGDGQIYAAGYTYGEWRCDCPTPTPQCSHLIALRLITAPDMPRGS